MEKDVIWFLSEILGELRAINDRLVRLEHPTLTVPDKPKPGVFEIRDRQHVAGLIRTSMCWNVSGRCSHGQHMAIHADELVATLGNALGLDD